jgi:hypothetical protein
MSAGSVAFLLSIGLLHRMLHCQRAANAFHAAERTTARLAAQFRSDVHSAIRAEVQDVVVDKPFLRLSLPGGKSVTYEHQKGRIVRVQTASDAKDWREEFAFPQPLRISLNEQRSPDRLELTMESALSEPGQRLFGPGGGPARVSLHVLATLPHSFAGGTAAEEVPR